MKILQVLLSDRIGGAETLARNLTEQWQKEGIAVSTHFLDGRGGNSIFRQMHRYFRLAVAIRRVRPDIVLSHSALPNLYARIVPSGGAKVVAVLHSAGDDFVDAKLRVFEKLLHARTSAVVAVSSSQLSVYRARFPDVRNLSLIPNGIQRRAKSNGTRRPGPLKIIDAARVAAQKDPKTWLAAAEFLLVQFPDVSFEWWGPIEDESLAVVPRGLENRIAFRGLTSKVGEILADGDIYFHSSTREAHSIGILEAAAAGLPVVCSDSVAQTLPMGMKCMTFRAGDAKSAGRTLEFTVRNFETLAVEARAQSDWVQDEFGIDRCSDSYHRLFVALTEAE